MPISLAYQKCPQAVFLPPDMEKYSRVSRQLLQIFYGFTPQIEPVSLDEAFLDVTASHHLFGGPQNLCRILKARVKKRNRIDRFGRACSYQDGGKDRFGFKETRRPGCRKPGVIA